MDYCVNLSPLAAIECSNTDGRSLSSNGTPLVGLSAIAMFRTKFAAPRHLQATRGYHFSPNVVLRRRIDDDVFKLKMRVLMKNPVIFQEFKSRLEDAKERSHSKEGVNMLLHEFLDKYVRIPELRGEIAQFDSEGSPSRKRVLVRPRRISMLASYLGGSEVIGVPTPEREHRQSITKKAESGRHLGKQLFADTSNLAVERVSSNDLTETSSGLDEDSDDDENFHDASP